MEYRVEVKLNKDRDTVVAVKCMQSGVILTKKLKGNMLSHCSEHTIGIVKADLKKRLLEGSHE